MASKLAQILLRGEKATNFRQLAKGLVAISDSPCVAELVVKNEHCNIIDTLHGGFTSFLVDYLSTCHLEVQGYPHGISVELSTMFLGVAKVGDTISIESNLLKKGRSMAFCTVTVTNKTNNDSIVAFGKHVKFFKN